MSPCTSEPRLPLLRSLATGRIHSAYLLSGPGEKPRETALWLARALVCQRGEAGPCGECRSCRLSQRGEEIPLGARVVAVADAYDAITSKRIYVEDSTHETALTEIRRNAGSQFDPRVVEAFLRGIGDFRDEYGDLHERVDQLDISAPEITITTGAYRPSDDD